MDINKIRGCKGLKDDNTCWSYRMRRGWDTDWLNNKRNNKELLLCVCSQWLNLQVSLRAWSLRNKEKKNQPWHHERVHKTFCLLLLPLIFIVRWFFMCLLEEKRRSKGYEYEKETLKRTTMTHKNWVKVKMTVSSTFFSCLLERLLVIPEADEMMMKDNSFN